ncbi:L-erythro-3,5-diaminohexanoate dehydrogenase [Saccharothrix violaceirubra]|uniref:L-erythro-3,5-diaminohexanoate dehydrogenase n=1 Tax=Saccharothrix violaceirubra TaxID=413306 RepID=A0A7W7WW76_9PSEU|nr:L-erythro-3,5-diaminohexanoate dehydrogenase [Saccharothrix violaceirubra]MBB4965821.1 L-erythro-3,5-diaminohexanoate dehydrogenase [Saccharothrix violaceirubra]
MSVHGLHRVLEPPGVLPQRADRLDPTPVCGPDEVLVDVGLLNLDAASFRQLREAHGPGIRDAVLDIVAARGKMQNPVTGSGGMLLGTVREVGPDSPLGLRPGDRVATLVSLTLTPLTITGMDWDGTTEQVPCRGTAILFARSIAAVLPDDLPDALALAVLDVCGAPALTDRVVRRHDRPVVLVLGAGGKSGTLSLVAARRAGASRVIGLVPHEAEADRVRRSGLADEVVTADARDPLAVVAALAGGTPAHPTETAPATPSGTGADVTVVCVDVPGCEHGAILATADGGTIVFFSMATSFTAAALGAEGLAADVEMLVGNGYVPGHAAFALDIVRTEPAVRAVFEHRQTPQP